MYWIHLEDEDYWRLVIASPLVTTQGSAAGYRLVNTVLRRIDLAGITLEDITLIDPESPQFRSLQSAASQSSRLAAGKEWVEFEDAVVYRWTGISLRAEISCDASPDELVKYWDAERKLVNLPSLVIDSDGSQVTLRFHPLHGATENMDGIKKSFEIALHRPNARPDCAVRWL